MDVRDGAAYTTKQIGTKPAPGDTKRMKAGGQKLETLWEPMFQSKVTLPKGTTNGERVFLIHGRDFEAAEYHVTNP